ncbi:Inositol-pentakisphosphate 2-kinase [Ceratocystis pirilliformis]|uniref:Inositol-pentakisphosphate 2-kinase n=1 Tax=Ceratocystis pirilliformis TaxID=259994 RepID=A0ABR3Z046_9PEZI
MNFVSAFPFCLPPHRHPSALLVQSLSLLAPNLYYRQPQPQSQLQQQPLSAGRVADAVAPLGLDPVAVIAAAASTSTGTGAGPTPVDPCEPDTTLAVAVAIAAALVALCLLFFFAYIARCLARITPMYGRRRGYGHAHSSCDGDPESSPFLVSSSSAPLLAPVSSRSSLVPSLISSLVPSPPSKTPPTDPPLIIPPGTRITEFMGEGSANVVVRIEIPQSCSPQTRRQFQGKLLRLQKASKHPENRPYPYATQHAYFQDHIVPLFPKANDLISHELVLLDRNNNIINQAHALLDLMDQVSSNVQHSRNQHPPTPEMLHESAALIHPDVLPEEQRERLGHSKIKRRNKQFIGSKLAYVEYGLLVEDMSINHDEDGILVEIKPKWLLQSTSAPPASARCRNCAIELHRARQGRLKQSRPKPCPLLLMSDNWRHRREFMAQMLVAVEPDEWYMEPLMRWAGGVPSSGPESKSRSGLGPGPNPLLLLLRDLQGQLDRKGPLCATEEDNAGFPLAMTMRDCSVFIRVVRKAIRGLSGEDSSGSSGAPVSPAEYSISVSAKIGDLDMKNAGAKLSYWKRTELELLHDDAYTDEDYQLKHRCGLYFSTPQAGLERS